MKNSKPYWRYQVINRGTKEKPSLGIHEVYLNTQKEGDLLWTQNPITLTNYNNIEELIDTLNLILKNIKTHPVLLESELQDKLK
ncbi:hypothetical protein HZQ28_17550 [Elizabethkingia anophelis]|uniref:hypothetical protein n=1 Tax=Elizabethkingia anophelis TaxID=1117645 RepID=UPI00136546C1|nr:hypothetical protein [Elizabethkingia anophelis]MCT3946678.1 hypothetical protein [Elizabethkingia anophelis]MCT3996292.1 hypothetical protein [Elizabethkingia anophelis]MCT3999947.1 hypothetical protein [Elizabethkingia anophelis]MCT4256502.1 hypothetical protein [Elizabethkingia anophelis]MDV3876170.1 hypothetical protein [Elizabethkingia anophelis]